MKLLTLNTHSLVEEDYEKKRELFVQALLRERPDVIALQEVNQSRLGEIVEVPPVGHVAADGIGLRCDNHAYRVAEELRKKGLLYHWAWLPMKTGYDKYDEGLAVFSRSPIEELQCVRISGSDSYDNFRTRYALGIYTADQWFYSVHTGRWIDGDESFLAQWKRLSDHLRDKKRVWLMGDFNSPAKERDTGYDRVRRDGWFDSYMLAGERDSGVTVPDAIDGWRDGSGMSMRIDYIWSNFPVAVRRSEVIFNGKRHEQVSDHFGVLVEFEKL